MKNDDILEGSLVKALLAFFFPILFGTFFQQLYNTADAFIVGNFVGKEALAAVGGSTGTLINLLVGFITGVASGATVITAQYYGKREYGAVSKVIQTGMFMAVSLGGLMMVIGIAFGPALLTMMRVPSDIYELSLIYMRIYFLGMIPSMIYNIGSGILRATGDSKRPVYFLVVSCIVNIVLDIVFVVLLPWGVAGASIATIAAQFVSCFLTLRVLSKGNNEHQERLFTLDVDHFILRNIVLIGLPTGIQSCLFNISNIFIQATVNGFGTDSVAAFTAFGKIDALFWMFSGAFGTAVLTIVGQNFGAGNLERAKKTMWVGLALDVVITIAISYATCLLGTPMISLFTQDEAVRTIGKEIIDFLAPTWVSFAIIEVFSSGIRACGNSLMTMLITAICICGVRILYLLFVPYNSLVSALYCYPLSWILTSTVFMVYYLSGRWLKKN